MSLSAAHRLTVSGAATVASTYTLDLVATAAGAALAVSSLLDGADRAQLLTLLAVSYLVWGAGLSCALGANFALLEATGTSTSLPSMVAYDLARARSASRRLRRLAAGVGYVGTELAKEAPYYAEHQGAAALSEAITSRDALVFLIGTNLGAAAYEAVLGITLRLGLRRGASRSEAPVLRPA
jgi:hypothetical protein